MASAFRRRVATIGRRLATGWRAYWAANRTGFGWILAWLAWLFATIATPSRVNALVVFVGMAFVAAAAFQVHEALGLAAVGLGLIVAGTDVRKR